MTSFPERGEMLCMERAGTSLTIQDRLGEGGQGVVYRASMGGGALFAVKWFRPSTRATELRGSISALVDRGRPPNPAFVWPLEVVTSDHRDGFGYLMPLLQPRFISFAQLLSQPEQPSFRVIATIGRQLVDAFAALHASGLCYRDISFGNLRVDPDTAEVAIIDNDNVGTDSSAIFVKGTLRFMAPEIVRGEALPSTVTDLHSLAVFLFYLFVHGHPLEGSRADSSHTWHSGGHISESELALRDLGVDPVFVFDPTETANRPPPGDPMLTWWGIYPKFFRAVFLQAFTTGLRDATLTGRVTEGVWRRALVRLHDSVTSCPGCSAGMFFDPQDPHHRCWHCGEVPPIPPRLEVRGHSLVLSEGAVLTSHHLYRDKDYRSITAAVEAHPHQPGHVVVRNLTGQPWKIWPEDESEKTVEPGQRLRARPMTIEFPGVRGRLVCGQG
jgi:DNA-binding helix-hairpin-helix protein with protein kinase domain